MCAGRLRVGLVEVSCGRFGGVRGRLRYVWLRVAGRFMRVGLGRLVGLVVCGQVAGRFGVVRVVFGVGLVECG